MRHVNRDLEIYLNRTIWRVYDPAEVPPDPPDGRDGPVLVIGVPTSKPPPAAPAGWEPLAQVVEKRQAWYAFIRPRGGPPG